MIFQTETDQRHVILNFLASTVVRVAVKYKNIILTKNFGLISN
jgi:hypothetical protein